MSKVPQHWIEKAKNKSWFYSRYLKLIKSEPIEADIQFAAGQKIHTTDLKGFLTIAEKVRDSFYIEIPEKELEFNGKKIWELK